MALTRISADAHIPAPAATVYGIFADYHEKHPSILPRPPFGDLVIEAGGQGAGTVFMLTMTMFGQKQSMQMVVSEPEPGRLLVETGAEQGLVTTFLVEPRGAAESHVTITTEMAVPDGPLGRLQGWFLQRMLQPVYHKELSNVAGAAAGPA